jgi:hypothetical protein
VVIAPLSPISSGAIHEGSLMTVHRCEDRSYPHRGLARGRPIRFRILYLKVKIYLCSPSCVTETSGDCHLSQTPLLCLQPRRPVSRSTRITG